MLIMAVIAEVHGMCYIQGDIHLHVDMQYHTDLKRKIYVYAKLISLWTKSQAGLVSCREPCKALKCATS